MMRLGKRMKGLNRDQRGLTAIELAVVVAILAVLAAIVAGNTTGMSTAARGSSKSTDIAEVQKAVDNFKGQHPRNQYPVNPQTGTLSTDTQIDFTASFTLPEGTTKTFVPDYLQRNAKHAVDAPSSWRIGTDGSVTNTLPDSSY